MGDTIAPAEHLQFLKKKGAWGLLPVQAQIHCWRAAVLLNCGWQTNNVTFTSHPIKTLPFNHYVYI